MRTGDGLKGRLIAAERLAARLEKERKAAARKITALKRGEEEYRGLVESANSIILRLDTTGNVVFLNEFGLTFFGYTRGEIIGKKLVGTIVPYTDSSGRNLGDLVKWICENPGAYSENENENIRKDGSRVWVFWTNRAVLDKKNRVTRILCIGSDITARKRAEAVLHEARSELETKVEERTAALRKAYDELQYEVMERKIGEMALRESEVKYRNIVDQAVEGIFQTSDEGKCIMANAALADMLGYETPAEFISAIRDVARQLYVRPGDHEELARLLDTTGYAKSFETQFYRKNGTTIWVSMNVRSVCDERGSFVCYEGTVEDLTVRKRNEEQLKESFGRLQRAMDGTIKALSMAVEIRDPYTAGHQVRVTELALAIARDLGFSGDRIKAIQMAGILHDIGKIYVPAEILMRPGKIDEHQIAVLRDHSQAGYEILKDIEFDHPIAQIVLQHHERLNGTGYPQGLSGEEISLDARIISVADVVESMASHRPYRPSLGVGAALKEIEENRGTLYDPEVVDVCLRLFREKGFGFVS